MGRPAKRLALILLAVIAAAVSATWLWVGAVERRLRARADDRVRELEAELLKRDPRRPALRGDALPGDAWEDYAPALSAVHALPHDLQRTLADRSYSRDGSPEQVAALGAILKGLRQGSRRAEARIFLEHHSTIDNSVPMGTLYSTANYLGNAAAMAGARLLDDGLAEEGVDLLLSAAQFGRDVAAHPDFMGWRHGIAVVHLVLEQVDARLQVGRVPERQARAIGAALAILDDTANSYSDDVSRDLLHWGRRALSGLPGEERTRGGPSPTWRQAYSRSIMELTAFLDFDQAAKSRAAHLALPHLQANEAWKDLLEEVASRRNPAATFMNSGVCSHRVIRESLVRLRLLRVALHYAATGEILDLADPMGERLRTSLRKEELLIWSAWRDGEDDGGAERGDKDRVLRVPRFGKR
ncbi:MAG TPA: hypothetical protein VF950_22660 [Planctomycetota bacterium]